MSWQFMICHDIWYTAWFCHIWWHFRSLWLNYQNYLVLVWWFLMTFLVIFCMSQIFVYLIVWFYKYVLKCHEVKSPKHQKSFNLTWWHLVTCHDLIKRICRGCTLYSTTGNFGELGGIVNSYAWIFCKFRYTIISVKCFKNDLGCVAFLPLYTCLLA